MEQQYVVTIISLSVTALAAIGAFIAAIGSWKSARETRKTSLAQIVMQITGSYSSSDMGESVKRLHDWKRQHPQDFAALFKKGLRETNNITNQLDEDRRRVSHYFHQINTLLECGIIDMNFVKIIVKSDQVSTFLDVVEPLQEAKNQEYDHSAFNAFRKIYGKEIQKNTSQYK